MSTRLAIELPEPLLLGYHQRTTEGAMDFIRKTLPEQHYIYVDKEVPYGPEISDAMGAAFGEVFGFIGQNGITPLAMPI